MSRLNASGGAVDHANPVPVALVQVGVCMAPTATPEPLEPTSKEPPACSSHPDAPHGFDRNQSHSLQRYACECESWVSPEAE